MKPASVGGQNVRNSLKINISCEKPFKNFNWFGMTFFKQLVQQKAVQWEWLNEKHLIWTKLNKIGG